MVVVAYGQIIPKRLLNIPKFGTINVHPSDLPKYRGPAPIQYALLNGDEKTAITIMKMDERMDHGPILDKKYINIDTNDNYFSLERKILQIGPIFLIKILKKYLDNNIKAKQQNHKKATFSKLIKKEDGLIDWSKSAKKIHNQIRAFTAWPKAYTILSNNKRLIFLKSKFKYGKLKPILVQLEGKKPIEWKNFLNGYKKLLSDKITKKLIKQSLQNK